MNFFGISGMVRRARCILSGRRQGWVPVELASSRGQPPRASRETILEEYAAVSHQWSADTVIFYRIIGNDLPPRHEEGQCARNLAFILENEAHFDGCEKRFVVNRIVDAGEEKRIIQLLIEHDAPFIHIPFVPEDYRKVPWCLDGIAPEYFPFAERYQELDDKNRLSLGLRLYRHKNNYVMNNNGARNAALREGRGLAKWVLPWDGNCFLTESAWSDLRQSLVDCPEVPYRIVPMARITDNARVLEAGYLPEAREEPQVIFRADARLEFDELFSYGNRPKAELLLRLGVPGPWEGWKFRPWDLPVPEYSPDAGRYMTTGWVARLNSGMSQFEHRNAIDDRGRARALAITAMLDRLDREHCIVREQAYEGATAPGPGPTGLTIECSGRTEEGASSANSIYKQLELAADEALGRGPYSVVHKTTMAPSKDLHDYCHPAPYFWPHPLNIPGLPHVRRDGQRVPGTRLYEPLSERYDRTQLQRMFDDTFVLCMAYKHLGNAEYAEYAATLVRTWFLESATLMNPHLAYAQFVPGRNRNQGLARGIIEFKDIYFFLDAATMLVSEGCLDPAEVSRLHAWFDDYLRWLLDSPQGRLERSALNNHGTYFDLQAASIASFLGDEKLLYGTLRDSRFRILSQIMADGSQPEELRRSISLHYCCFNLQGWIHLAQLAEKVGEDVWSFEGSEGQGLRSAMEWLLAQKVRDWEYPQEGPFDDDRMSYIYHAYREQYGACSGDSAGGFLSKDDLKCVFHPHDGIPPFWQLR